MMFALQKIHLKYQVLLSLKINKKINLECCLLQFCISSLRVKTLSDQNINFLV